QFDRLIGLSLSQCNFSLQEMHVANLLSIFCVGERGDETLHLFCLVQSTSAHVLPAQSRAKDDFWSNRREVTESVVELPPLGAYVPLSIREDGEPEMNTGLA